MTTPDSSETPQPSRARLSAFLGGWARFQSKSGDSPDDAGSPAADDAPGAGAGAPDTADAADAGGADAGGAAPDAPDAPDASDGAEASGTADEDRPEGPDADDAVAGAADDADDQAGEFAELDESTELVDHVIEAADPRDFADDAGPQYEDEDFDEDIEEDDREVGHVPTSGRADAVVPGDGPPGGRGRAHALIHSGVALGSRGKNSSSVAQSLCVTGSENWGKRL